MEKRYISVDVETSGNSPGRYSMLSIGACLVNDPSINFYRELKPINSNFIPEAMKVSCKGLRCLEELIKFKEYDTESELFDPKKVLDVLYEVGEYPAKVMTDYAEWIKTNTNGYKAVEVAAPIKFDGGFTLYYFGSYYDKENPLRHTGEDINSMYRGLMRDVNANIEDLGFRGKGLTHNALEDAILQAKEFAKVLEMLKK